MLAFFTALMSTFGPALLKMRNPILLLLFGCGIAGMFLAKTALDQIDAKLAHIEQALKTSQTALPFAIIEFGLVSANSPAEIAEQIEQWKLQQWGAQLASLQILCLPQNRESLATLVPVGNIPDICRIAK